MSGVILVIAEHLRSPRDILRAPFLPVRSSPPTTGSIRLFVNG
jgi:hypothetical protein